MIGKTFVIHDGLLLGMYFGIKTGSSELFTDETKNDRVYGLLLVS